MGFFSKLFGMGATTTSRQGGAQPPPSKAGAGASVDKGRHKTKTEKDLRRVTEEGHAAAARERRGLKP